MNDESTPKGAHESLAQATTDSVTAGIEHLRDMGTGGPPMSTIRQQLRTVTLPNGVRAVVVDAVIPDDAPQPIREGLARRAIVNSGGDCPCGASWPRPNRAQRRKLQEPGSLIHVVVEHARDCPAETENLAAIVREWVANR